MAHAGPARHPHASRPRGRAGTGPAGIGAPRHDHGRGRQLQPRHGFRLAAAQRRRSDPRLLRARGEHPEVRAAQGRGPHRLGHDGRLPAAPRFVAARTERRAAAAALDAAHRGDGHGRRGEPRANCGRASPHAGIARDGDAAGVCGLLDRRHSVPLPRERTAHRQAHPRPARDARGTQVAARHRARARPRLAVHARRREPHQDVPAFLLHQRPAFRQATAHVRAHGRGPHARAQHLEAVPGDRGPAELAARRRPVSFPGAGDALPHVRGRRDLPDLRGIRLVAAAHVVRHRGRRRAPSHHGDRRVRRTLRQRVARLGRRVDVQS